MCGLIFAFDRTRDSATLAHAAKRVLKRLAHRGPDASGLLTGPGYLLGHRRLSIVDLGASIQPMQDPSGRYVLVYNGEIYNYQQLRANLAACWDFHTKGDTEVLLAGIITEGTGFLAQAEGMWSFAFWDRREETLLLARDRMGKKPLYYQATNSGCMVASELPALLGLLTEAPGEDLDSTADFLRYGYQLPGFTAYQGIKEVLPGHWLTWSPRTRTVTSPYWTLPIGGFTGTPAAAREQLATLMTEAVERRLVADVEVGAFLSGGIDSSIVVALTTRMAATPPKTFTIGFAEAAFDERQYAAMVARHLGTDHYADVLGPLDPDQLKQLVLHHVGQPFGDSSILPTALVSRVAARQVKVVLSGDGGDELFCGYQRYLGRNLLRWYSRLPRFLRRSTELLIRTIPEPMAHHSRSFLKKAHLFVDLIDRADSETPYIAPVLYSRAEFAQLAPELADRGHTPPMLPAECDVDDVWRMMTADALVYLPQDILVKVDRASMSASLEARAPFLDRAIVELAFSLPPSFHRSGLTSKRLLRDTFYPLLPDLVWKRRKQGFAVPIHHWFRAGLGNALEDNLSTGRWPFDVARVCELLASHRRSQRDYGHRLWQFYIYCLWRELLTQNDQ